MQLSHLPYIFVEIYCILFTGSILFRLDSSIGTEHQIRALACMIYAYLGMLLSDVFWTAWQDSLLPACAPLALLAYALLVAFFTLGCYFWYRFVEDRLHLLHRDPRLFVRLMRAPLLAVCALMLLSVLTGGMRYADGGVQYRFALLRDLPRAVGFTYLLVPTAASLWRVRCTTSREERNEYLTYAFCAAAPLIGFLLGKWLPYVPILALNIFMIIHILFLMIQNLQIYNDALTELSNRRRLNQFLEECLPKASEKRPVVILMMDLNRFKSINDTYGHLEGDRALEFFADVLKTAAFRHNAFIARFGGDEFCLVTDDICRNPAKVAQDIHSILKTAQQKAPLPYALTVSIGAAVYTAPVFDVESALNRADEDLYQSKKDWHRQNGCAERTPPN